MRYTPVEKARMDALLAALAQPIAQSHEFDIAYSEKSGFLQLVIAPDAEQIYFPLENYDQLRRCLLFHLQSDGFSREALLDLLPDL